MYWRKHHLVPKYTQIQRKSDIERISSIVWRYDPILGNDSFEIWTEKQILQVKKFKRYKSLDPQSLALYKSQNVWWTKENEERYPTVKRLLVCQVSLHFAVHYGFSNCFQLPSYWLSEYLNRKSVGIPKQSLYRAGLWTSRICIS